MGRERLHPSHRQLLSCRAAAGVLALSAGLFVAAWATLGLRPFGLGRFRLRRVVVTGDSMLPAFEHGDRLVLGPTGRLRPGQVIALPDPRDATRLLIKRIRTINDTTLEVRGDNDAASTDSRDFGLVPRAGLVGRVVYRYAPPGRTGWMPG
jgi:nickel-type superoxide dismutase maturation protease